MIEKVKVKEVEIKDVEIIKNLFGYLDKNIKLIEEELEILIRLEDNSISIHGGDTNVDVGERVILSLLKDASLNENIDQREIRIAIDNTLREDLETEKDIIKYSKNINVAGRIIKPKTIGQRRYINSMYKNDVVFGIGPAGTGKTYLAMAMATKALKDKEVDRIIITRPVVEAGESLGFLPGDLQEKVDPYLRPIYDSLFNILGKETYNKYMERGLIEIAPLAYMRGRTLESSYIILDEAQNTTKEQMKMFLTRIGFNSKAIITGDMTQTDLARGKESGLDLVTEILKDIKGIDFIYLNKGDIVRHNLVQKIIEAYENYEEHGAD